MQTIYKYELELKETQTLSIPPGSEILSIDLQGQHICAWIRVDTDYAERDRVIVMAGTGTPLSDLAHRHISTIQMDSMVWHFFESMV